MAALARPSNRADRTNFVQGNLGQILLPGFAKGGFRLRFQELGGGDKSALTILFCAIMLSPRSAFAAASSLGKQFPV